MNPTITHKYLRNLLDNLSEENFDDFLVELQFSTLIAPVNEYGGVPVVEFNNKEYMPLFTDIHEFHKFKNHDEFTVVDHEFNFYLELLKSKKIPRFVINPDSEKFPITEEYLKFIEPNYIFDQEYQPFTTNEIRKIKDSIKNIELNEFLKDESNFSDLSNLIKKLENSTLLTLLISHNDYNGEAERGVIFLIEKIPKCLYGVWDKNYILLFSRQITKDTLPDDSIFKYTQIINFPLLVKEVLNYDFDGFLLNVNEENITIPREHLRNYMKDFSCPVLDDYGMYAFTVPEGENDV